MPSPRGPEPREPALDPSLGFSTRAIRAAARSPRVRQIPTAVPIYQTATFAAEDADELAAVTRGDIPGFTYGRLQNPTSTALQDAFAELEGADAGFAFATGMAAIHAALLSLLRAGDRVVATRNCYGSTRSLLTHVFGELGVRVDFVDMTDLAATEQVLRAEKTTVVYAETIANPTTVVLDHAALAGLAHRHGAAYVVDNTFASPYVCRPIELGADLVIESATKWLGGHSDVMGGLVAGDRTRIKAIGRIQIDTGATLAPFSAFLILRGIQTLAIRMDRHASTALALAGWLERQDGVSRVNYPGLASHPQRAVAERELRLGGGMLAFELAGGRDAGPAFVDALQVPELTASLGSVHTIVIHPPTTSHRMLNDAELAEAGIGPGLLRVSVGLEDLDDLVADFGAALEAVRPLLTAPASRTAATTAIGR
jgi:methionine-gamma-lyase